MNRRRFRLLVTLFQDRFFENDTVSPGGGFQTNIYQVLGFLIAAGWFISYFVMPPFFRLSMLPPGEQTEWAARNIRLFFSAWSFAVIGFATIFEWDMLFPDRRDFLVLGSFPLRLSEIFAAKFAALGRFLLLLVAAMNVFPVLMIMVLSVIVPDLRGNGLRLVAAQLAATGSASLFAFLAVAAFQGLLISVSTPRLFQRISPWIQMFGMSAMVLCVLMYPLYSILLRPAAASNQTWLWLFPVVWFAGVYDVVLSGRSEMFLSLGLHGLKGLAGAAVLFAAAWAFGFRRHYSRTLESEDVVSKRARRGWPAWLVRSPEERAIADFSGRTLARSRKHEFFLATYISVGLAVGILFAVAVRSSQLVISVDGLRVFPFFIAFFVISGFRAVFQFPAELAANWLFRITEAGWAETARTVTRKQVLLSGLAPAIALVAPVELIMWDWRQVLLHAVFQFAAGALLVEILFWTFDKVPFTCSWFPGRTSLSLLAGLYLYGFTTYSFHMADLERFMESHWSHAVAAFACALLLLVISWRRHPAPAAVRFDGEEPAIQTLDLT